MVARTYLDSSAIIRWVLREPEWEALAVYLESHPERFTSRLSFIEVGRSLMRLPGAGRTPLQTRADSILGVLSVVEITHPVVSAAAGIGPPTLRSLDAIHLASYVTLRPDIEDLVTYDVRLAEAVRAIGGQAVSP